MGVPSRKDIDALIKRIDALSAKVGGKAASKPAPARKAAAKPAAKAPSQARRSPQGGVTRARVSRRRASAWRSPAAARLGAIYEIGALCALDETLDGLDFNQLDGYVGVSAGGFIAAGLANGMTPRELCAAFIENDTRRRRPVPPFAADAPGLGRIPAPAGGTARPGRAGRVALRLQAPFVARGLERLGRALPTGLLSGAAMERQLAHLFSAPGRSNDFRQLAAQAGAGGDRSRQRRRGAVRPTRSTTTCRSRWRCRPAPRCPACSRRWS